MTLDLAAAAVLARPGERPGAEGESYWSAIDEATRGLPAPVVALSVDALAWNARDLARRAGGIPIRVASKSLRVRGVLDAVLELPAFRGVLAYTLSEALWLAESIEDVVVGYPSADLTALRELGSDPLLASRITIMVDSREQLDLVDHAIPAAGRAAPIRVCLDLDASWRSRALGHIGVRRSPVRTPAQLAALAAHVAARPGFVVVGVMAYEAQIAGVADRPRGRPAEGALLRAIQRASGSELAERRAAAIDAVREVAELEFVNGGGTGSLERTAAEPAVTELAAGSGLFGPHLFDHYGAFDVAPAVGFGLDVVRKPTPDRATLLGGGWIASGPPGDDRLPRPQYPAGLEYEPREAAGEVQTPLRGPAAQELTVGDRVWFRHAKSGEIMEHANEVVPVSGDGAAHEPLLTYRGEGKCFL